MVSRVKKDVLGVGIIGCGNISTTYLANAPLFKGIEMVAHDFRNGKMVTADFTTLVKGSDILEGNEWSPQQWLPEPTQKAEIRESCKKESVLSLFRTMAAFPELIQTYKVLMHMMVYITLTNSNIIQQCLSRSY